MTIFLTGGNGEIGSIMVDVLKKANIEVISPSSTELNLNKEFDVTYYPEVDGFIHCAGVNNLKSHDSIVLDELYNVFKINTVSFIELCSQLKFKTGSNIIAIGSLYATTTKENRIQYTTSKHALLGAVKTIALEKSVHNIKVNMISPGFVNTSLTRQNNSQERITYLDENIPLGLTNPLEIANFCLYLIRYNNSITGQYINIDGGYTLKGI